MLAVAVLMGSLVRAQERPPDRLELIDGRVLQGRVLQMRPGAWVRFETEDGVHEFPFDDLRHIKQAIPAQAFGDKEARSKWVAGPADEGWGQAWAVGAGWGASGGLLLAHYRLLRRWRPAFKLGIGTGLENYGSGWLLPVWGEWQGDLGRGRWRPHGLFQLGHGFALSQDASLDALKGGMMGHLGLGVSLHTRKRHAWHMTFGYKVQQAQESERLETGSGTSTVLETSRRYQRLLLMLSMSF